MSEPDPVDPVLAAAEQAERLEAARKAGFYPLMLLVDRLLGEGARVGTGLPLGEERVRFRHDPALEFSTADAAGLRVVTPPPDPEDLAAERKPVLELTTTFLGLTGAVSPLPTYMAEEIAQEDPDQPRQRAFLDMFHHRVLSLFVRARARGDWPAGYAADQGDAWSRRVLALIGRDPDAAPRGGAPRWKLLRWAGLLAERAMPAPALAAAIADAVEAELDGAGVDIEELAGAWVDIAASQVCRLGRSGSRLGQDLLVGRRIFDRAGKFRVVLGPLGKDGFGRFAQGTPALARVAEAVRALVPEPLDFEVVLWLRPEAVPRLELSSRGLTRLGRNSWLTGRASQTRIKVDLPS